MKIFDKMYSFFESLVEYTKSFSNLFLIFVGAFLLVSVVIIIMTSFAYECKLTKTVDKINKFFERNPKINDDNLVAFNNMMKGKRVPKTLRRQWQQFMLYREHPASYYMSFKHCVENPLRNSTYSQQMTVYKVISFVLVAISFIMSAFMTVEGVQTNRVLMDILIIPITILVLYWLISMVLNLVHNAISGDLFQNYQYFEINIDKAMLTLPEFVDYEVLFSQDEIRRGIPVLFAYLQKRALQEQHELEKARLKSVDHEKFDFDKAGLDGSLVLDRAMRETENYTTQRKKYMQETERVNNEISVLENNYKEQTKEFQRQVQTSKETVENLKEQLEQANSTIEINYIKKQMRDELNRQQLAEKDFDILTDKHNQAIKTLNQEIKHYEDETKKAKEAMEVAMLSEFNTYSVKVYDNLEKIVDEKMQDKVDNYKDQIKGLEIELEEKSEELDNVYTRYQEALSQIPVESAPIPEEVIEEIPAPKGKKNKKSSKDSGSVDNGGMVQPELDPYTEPQYAEQYNQEYYGDENVTPYEEYDNTSYDDYNNNVNYEYDQQLDNSNYDQYVPAEGEYTPMEDNYAQPEYAQDEYVTDETYVPMDNYSTEDTYTPQQDEYYQEGYSQNEYGDNGNYSPVQDDYSNAETYIPQQDEYNQEVYPQNGYAEDETYVPLQGEDAGEISTESEYTPLNESLSDQPQPVEDDSNDFDTADFNIDFGDNSAQNKDSFDDMDFNFDLFGEDKTESTNNTSTTEEDEDFDLNKVLGLYDTTATESKKENESEDNVKEDKNSLETEEDDEDETADMVLGEPVVKRKAGRPRKIVDESELDKPKRKAGRPRKVVDESEIEKPKRKAGRPRKIVDESEETQKRKPGRPKKTQDDNALISKPSKGRGRPRKSESSTNNVPKTSTGKRGRPRKQVGTTSVVSGEGVLGKPKRKVGRPRKADQ